MTKTIKLVFTLIVLTLISIGSLAQLRKAQPSIPRWVSEKGYWVIETNTHFPLDHIVRFYNNAHALVYQEALSGVKLKPEKRKVKMKLKQLLEAAVTTWEIKKKPEPLTTEEFGLVKTVL